MRYTSYHISECLSTGNDLFVLAEYTPPQKLRANKLRANKLRANKLRANKLRDNKLRANKLRANKNSGLSSYTKENQCITNRNVSLGPRNVHDWSTIVHDCPRMSTIVHGSNDNDENFCF